MFLHFFLLNCAALFSAQARESRSVFCRIGRLSEPSKKTDVFFQAIVAFLTIPVKRCFRRSASLDGFLLIARYEGRSDSPPIYFGKNQKTALEENRTMKYNPRRVCEEDMRMASNLIGNEAPLSGVAGSSPVSSATLKKPTFSGRLFRFLALFSASRQTASRTRRLLSYFSRNRTL